MDTRATLDSRPLDGALEIVELFGVRYASSLADLAAGKHVTYADWDRVRAGDEVFATCADNFEMRSEFTTSGLTDRKTEYEIEGLPTDGPRALWFRALWGDHRTGTAGPNLEVPGVDRRRARGFHLHPASHNTLTNELKGSAAQFSCWRAWKEKPELMESCHERTPFATNLTHTERLECILCRKCENSAYLQENAYFDDSDFTKSEWE